jgi:hypothetical protein
MLGRQTLLNCAAFKGWGQEVMMEHLLRRVGWVYHSHYRTVTINRHGEQ